MTSRASLLFAAPLLLGSGGLASAILLPLDRRPKTAQDLSEDAGLGDRIDIFGIEQFIALNLYELGQFATIGRRTAVADLVARYNEIVDEVETDPSLRIDFRNRARLPSSAAVLCAR